ncbi:DUF2236 domain-containing protein [Spongiibacter sp. KMU-166]|uniref:DUF2236 domain-containing protein n=1 Tax=Spongiibacter thalassae TaxID=2721624 RepID=A0ABX1G9P1_9GAMM|nr:oxygenase MpaB family protein [Spongiibacter thalassae]NKI15872.1 DUF2236 domain-containing protein [Spongiibacter thalassae]
MSGSYQEAGRCPVGGKSGDVRQRAEQKFGAEANDSGNADWALGPGSVTWKVLRNPAVFFIGMLRTSMLIPLHPPFASAAELDTSYLTDPLGRFRRIAVFAYMAGFGSKRDAVKVSKYVIKSHTMIKGIEPITQKPFQANSEYELALTLAVQTFGFLVAYEALYGALSDEQRDQFVVEQKVLGAVIGVNPDHVPSSYNGLLSYLAEARIHWAAGLASRNINAVFVDADFPSGSLVGELPWYKRTIVMWVLRVFSDMALALMVPEERLLIGINRSPKLRSRGAVNASFRLFGKLMGSKKGIESFASFVGAKAGGIFLSALEVESRGNLAQLEKDFVVPNPKDFFIKLPDLVMNWPGTPAKYRLGG